ncbi:MAG: Gfo/Idh/MocA family protein [Mycetocola sp.]
MLPSTLPAFDTFATDAGEPALRWGILAPGWIADKFVTALRHTIQRPVAVGSRSLERAEAFAAQHGIGAAYGSYREVMESPDVDVIYIAAPQSEHLTLGLQAIAAGKNVMIEKPLATTAADAATLVEAARAAGVLLMEAMWSRYLPQAALTRAILAEGILGELRGVYADHGQSVPFDPEHRLYRADLGGGALFDLGIYPVQFDSMVFGAPRAITAIGGLAPTGVDAFATVVLDHGENVQSTLATSILAKTPTTASIMGDQARLDFAGSFYIPTSLRLADTGHATPTVDWSDDSGRVGIDGLSWEATALAAFVGEGRTESPLHTLDETVSIISTLEEAVRQLSVK